MYMSNLRGQSSFEIFFLLMRVGRIIVCNLTQNPLYNICHLQEKNIFTRTSLATKKSKSMKSLPELNRNPCLVATSKAVGKILESTFFSPSVLEEGKTRS